VLDFLYIPVSWVLLRWHQLFTALGMNNDSGLNWALSIVALVITARLLLFRVFIKQVKHMRRMQEMQPKIQQLRDKYKNDKAEMQRQMMKLQQDEGFNMAAGCLPMFLQFPIFIALFHVLKHLSNQAEAKPGSPGLTLYTFTEQETQSAAHAKLFDAPLAGTLTDAKHVLALGGDMSSTRIVILVLVAISALATLYTQILVRQAAITQPEGTAATVQKLMMVGIPASVVFSGVFFPLGVLLYWFTSNTWTMGQQLYINKYHPHTPTETPAAGVAGKALAPPPGKKPVRPKPGSPVPPSANDADSAGTGSNSADVNGVAKDETSPGPAATRPVRPKTTRPGGKPGTRPGQTRKRR